jgi:hypothetical protein
MRIDDPPHKQKSNSGGFMQLSGRLWIIRELRSSSTNGSFPGIATKACRSASGQLPSPASV